MLFRSSRPEKGDWLEYLFNLMDLTSFDSFRATPVRFITYNYDRRIEERISNGLRGRFRASDLQVATFWEARPVIHLHGSVGSLTHGPTFVPYGALTNEAPIDFAIRGCIERAASGVRVVHQADAQSFEFQQARALLREAARVIFLGFSFGETNVDRLGLQNIQPGAVVICSRFGMTDVEAELAIQTPFQKMRLARVGLGKQEEDCRELLRNHQHSFVTRYSA